MSLITLFITLILVGAGLYLVNQVLPIDPKIKTILNVVVVILVIIWLLQGFGLFAAFDRPIRPLR